MLGIIRVGLLVGAVAPSAVGAMTPILDSHYGTNGVAHLAFDIGGDKKDEPKAAALLADGSLLVGGVSDVQGDSGVGDDNYHQAVLGKFTPAGLPDSNFGDNGRRTLAIVPPNGAGELNDIALTQSGGIAVVGTYSNSVNDTPPYFISFAMLKSDGAPDLNFNLGGYRNIGANAFLSSSTSAAATRIVPLAGGKLLGLAIVGNASGYCSALIRLKSDGTTDSTFAPPNGFACYTTDAPKPAFLAIDLVVLSSGKILVGGVANHGNDSTNVDMAVLRLLEDGTIDDAFGDHGWAFVAFDQGGALGDEADAIAVDSQGRIVLAGIVQKSTSFDMGIARLLDTGQPDPDFGSGGRVIVAFDLGGFNEDHANAISVLSGDRLLIGGWVDTGAYVGPTMAVNADGYFAAAVRLNEDGSLDPFFGDSGRYVEAAPSSDYPDVIIRPPRFQSRSDFLYLPGISYKNNGADEDFGVARVIVPIFEAGFEAN